MGKSKQRTKNNTKPSNSQRSADLLAESGFNFIGFSNLNEGGLISCLKNVDMNHVDPNFQLLLRKMNKKDSTTKYKALQEFSELCQDSELSNVEATLPFWPRLYCALAIDVEHRVREAAQVAHATLVKRMGKKIATHLKQLAGAWFISQYDTYPPASSAAENSFNATFPPNKIVNAIIHCQDEILTCIWRNLIIETPQSLSINKSLTSEEMEAKYQRVLISSMQAYAAYLKTVPEEEIEKTLESHRKIINDGKFWKLAKHKETPIKIAFYNVLTAIINHAICLLNEEKKKVISIIMNNIDETEPPLTAAIFEAAIVTINIIQDWHQMINVEKTILPKLYFILKNSGQNCATIVYPNLLPLLSNLMKLDIEKKQFYKRLFDNMREGMHVKKVVVSRSEIQIIITTFFECFRYVVHYNNTDLEMCESLMKEQLLTTISTILSDSFTYRSIYFSELSGLIHYWSKNRDSNCYSKLLSSFWSELTQLYKEMQKSDSSACLADFGELLTFMRNRPSKVRKNMKVTFSDFIDSEKDEPKEQLKVVDKDEKFTEEIETFIIDFCTSYFNEVVLSPNKKSYENLIKLAKKFASKQFFEVFAKTHNSDGNLLKFYDENLRVWMSDKETEAKHVMPLIFIILDYVNEEEQNRILVSLFEFDDILLYNALQCALTSSSLGSKYLKTIQKWCHETKITELLMNVTQNLIENKSDDKFLQIDTVLRMAFKVSKDGGLFISEHAVNGISSLICETVNHMCAVPSEYINLSNEISHEIELEEKPTEPTVSQKLFSNLIKLLSDLLELTLKCSKIFSGSVKMLETVLLLNMTDDISEHYQISFDSWQKALSHLIPKVSHDQLTDLIKSFSLNVWKKLFESSGMRIQDSLINTASMFLKVIYENFESDEFSKLALIFFSTLDAKVWLQNVYEIILPAEVMSGNQYISNLKVEVNIWNENQIINIINENINDCMDKCLKWAVTSAGILNKLNDYAEEDESTIIDIPQITNSIVDIIKLSRKYKVYYKLNKLYKDVSLLSNILKTEFDMARPTKTVYSKDISDDLTRIVSNTVPEDEDTNTLISVRTMNSAEEISSTFNRVMDKIVQRNCLEPSILLQDTNIEQVPWEKMTLALEFIRTITYYISKHPENLTTFQWDTILISLASWQLSINQSKHHYDDFKVMTFTVAVCQLYCAVKTLMLRHEKKPIAELPLELLDEWKNVFMDETHAGIAKTWMLYSDFYNQKEIPLVTNILLDTLGQALQLIDKNIFFKQTHVQSVKCAELINISLKLLQSPILSLQLSAYHALQHVIEEIVKEDRVKIQQESFETKSLNIYKFENILAHFREQMDVMLGDLKLCDTFNCLIEPYSDVYTSTVGYLFVWITVLDMCAKADGDLRYQYGEMLRNEHFSSLLNNIFKLVPSEVLHDNNIKYPKLIEIFNSAPQFNFEDNWTVTKLEHMVCWIYASSLRCLPVLVRQWWSTTDSRVCVIIDRITTVYVSPMLCLKELTNFELFCIENMQMKILTSTRELMAIYKMDDTKLELSIALPVNYPLGPVTIIPNHTVRGNSNLTNCHMQLSLFLTHQNGSIWEGLLLWKKNLDKRFSGVEECYICFSILHYSTYEIPKLSCSTCRKKFHTPCLYKWFNTSQKSTCPICRNVF